MAMCCLAACSCAAAQAQNDTCAVRDLVIQGSSSEATTPARWHKFSAQRAGWLFAFHMLIGLASIFMGLVFDFVYAPFLVRHGFAERATSSFIRAPWQRVALVNLTANLVLNIPFAVCLCLWHAGAFWPVQLQFGVAPRGST